MFQLVVKTKYLKHNICNSTNINTYSMYISAIHFASHLLSNSTDNKIKLMAKNVEKIVCLIFVVENTLVDRVVSVKPD